MKCPCGGEMQQGFIPDFGTAATWTAIWVPGQPDLRKSVRERIQTGAGVSVDRASALMLEAYRCEECGLIQLYARRQAPAGASPAGGGS